MKELAQTVQTYLDERGWNDQPLDDIAKSIIIEAAELLEHFQWSSYFKEKPAVDPKTKAAIMEELADVFIYAIEMALTLGVDIDEIVKAKLIKASEKYPPGAVKGALGAEAYRAIKEQYRQKKTD